MTNEGGYYYVDLSQEEGIFEIFPYLYTLLINGRKGILTSPNGLFDGANINYDGHIEAADVSEIIQEYIFDSSDSDNLSLIIAALTFILCNEDNRSKINPYSPGEVSLLAQFTELFSNDFVQEFMRKFWEYEEKEQQRLELQRKAETRIEVRILGQLASGKTTFLDTILRNLALDRINLRKHGTEPEAIEDYYPEYQVVNHYMASRFGLRSGATLGSESLRLFGVDESDQKIVELEVHSAGGHMHAERPPSYHDFGASAFFIDYELIQELQTLDESTDIKHVLCNGETVLQSVLSLLSRLCEWEEIQGPKLAVVSKLPTETELTEDIYKLIDLAHTRVFQYAKAHLTEITEEANYSGADVTFPKEEKFSKSTANWRAIRNDAPTYTGTMEVLHKLISLANGKTHTTLLTFDENANQPNTVFYKDIL